MRSIRVVTLFPEFFAGPLSVGLVSKAGVSIEYVDPRAFTTDRHRTVDDAPYGGGPGMVMKPEPLVQAIAKARGEGPVVLLTPQGKPLDQADLARWAAAPDLTLVATRYEGFDERVVPHVSEEVSIGDYVLTGGEYAALVIIDGVIRLLPGTLGNAASSATDSFSHGLLEGPQYTRPEHFEGARVPDVLLSGDHSKVASWRKRAALSRTRQRRPDLLERLELDEDAIDHLRAAPRAEFELAVEGGALGSWIELAAMYGISCIHWVGEPQAVEAPLERPRVKSRRARERSDARHAQAIEAFEAARGRIRAYGDRGALRRALEGRRIVRVLGGTVAGPVATSVDPKGVVFDLIGLELAETSPPVAIQPYAPYRVTDTGLIAAALLERLIGES